MLIWGSDIRASNYTKKISPIHGKLDVVNLIVLKSVTRFTHRSSK